MMGDVCGVDTLSILGGLGVVMGLGGGCSNALAALDETNRNEICEQVGVAAKKRMSVCKDVCVIRAGVWE